MFPVVIIDLSMFKSVDIIYEGEDTALLKQDVLIPQCSPDASKSTWQMLSPSGDFSRPKLSRRVCFA